MPSRWRRTSAATSFIGTTLLRITQVVEGKKPAKLTGLTQEQMAKMEREMSNLQGQYKMVEQTYGHAA